MIRRDQSCICLLISVQIDDLETPYTTYCAKFCTGFDSWEPVVSNPRLRTTLALFSTSNPPPLSLSSSPHPSEPPIWTLDELFILPKGRLKYYKKLYTRLLKSTTPGRSDHKLLSGALEKLDKLIDTLDSRASIRLDSATSTQQMPTPPVETADEVVIDMRFRDSTAPASMRANDVLPPPPDHRDSGSTHGSSQFSGCVFSSSMKFASSSRAEAKIADAAPMILRLRRKVERLAPQRPLCQCQLPIWRSDFLPSGRWTSSRWHPR